MGEPRGPGGARRSVAALTDCTLEVLSSADYERIASLNSAMRKEHLRKSARALLSLRPATLPAVVTDTPRTEALVSKGA